MASQEAANGRELFGHERSSARLGQNGRRLGLRREGLIGGHAGTEAIGDAVVHHGTNGLCSSQKSLISYSGRRNHPR